MSILVLPKADVRLVTRRGVLASVAGGLAATCWGQGPAIVTSKNRVQAPGCTLAAEQTEGPYYVEQHLIRRDITEGKPGIPLHLEVTVVDGRSCQPLQNAAVNIWHCDASGVYSAFTANSPDGPPGGRPPFPRGARPPGPPPEDGMPPGPPPGFGPGGGGPPPFHHGPTDSTRFLRGIQMTDDSGRAQFLTIYPGWYAGRAIHIHLKVQTAGSAKNGQYEGGHVCHTGQLFFPEDVSDAVARIGPYGQHHSDRTRQPDDDIFLDQHGSDFLLGLVQLSPRSIGNGFMAKVVMGVDPNATPKPVGFGGPPPPRG